MLLFWLVVMADVYAGSRKKSEGQPTYTYKIEQPHHWEKHHTVILNIKTTNLWILLHIKCSTSNFLSNIGHISHTCTQQSPSQVWVHQFNMFTPQAEALSFRYTYTCTALPHSTEPAAWTLFCHEDFRQKEPVEPFVEPRLWYYSWVTRGA